MEIWLLPNWAWYGPSVQVSAAKVGCDRVTTIATVQGPVTAGSVLTWSRRYDPAELAAYGELLGSPGGPAGILPDLLVLAPLTKLGGDLNYLSRSMEWRHHRPVQAGETLTAELHVTRLERTGDVVKIAFDARVLAGGEVVVSGTSRGLILGA
jgi:hypothetical protein